MGCLTHTAVKLQQLLCTHDFTKFKGDNVKTQNANNRSSVCIAVVEKNITNACQL